MVNYRRLKGKLNRYGRVNIYKCNLPDCCNFIGSLTETPRKKCFSHRYITDRRNSMRSKKVSILLDDKVDSFTSFRKFWEVIEWDLLRGLVYYREKRTKVCVKCGTEMQIGLSLPVHNRTCKPKQIPMTCEIRS